MNALRPLYQVAFALLLIGGLNWFFIGVAEEDLVVKVFGEGSDLVRIVYSLVGVSALLVGLLKGKDIMDRMSD